MIPELRQNLVEYIGKYTQLKKVSAHEYAGPCPVCSGRDRFHVHDTKGFFCRHCTGDQKFGDLADFTKLAFGWTLKETLQRFNLDRRATPEEIATMDAERKTREEQERKTELEKQAEVACELTVSGIAQVYNRNLTHFPEARKMWNARGLSDDWIAYYSLGYCPSRKYGEFTSASLTIPYIRPNFAQNPEGGADVAWNIVQLKHRLLASDAPGGKYRSHFAGAGSHLFYTDLYQRHIMGDLLIVEGEIKAMVTWSTLWIGDDCFAPRLTVIGIPGQGWRSEWAEEFNRADRVMICLDPDAQKSAARLAGMITKPVKNILLPDKIDDLINMGVLDAEKLLAILRD